MFPFALKFYPWTILLGLLTDPSAVKLIIIIIIIIVVIMIMIMIMIIITIVIIVIIYFLIIIVVQFYGKVEPIGVIRWFVLNQVKEAWIIINSPNGILGKKNESGTGENWRKRIRQKQIK